MNGSQHSHAPQAADQPARHAHHDEHDPPHAHGHHEGHEHGHGHSHRHGAGSGPQLIWALLLTLAFAAVEALVGWWAGSLALL
ncbi:MAG TPA: cation transporter, partial [Accumulibacter sp.]|nr:cation transporter [Accumulibacter sp.]